MAEIFMTNAVCGKRHLVTTPGGPRIVGGREPPAGAWPWLVSLQIRAKHHCGGGHHPQRSLGAHGSSLLQSLPHGQPQTLQGGGRASTCSRRQESHSRSRAVRALRVHEGFSAASMGRHVALLRLASPWTFDDYVQPVCTTPNGSLGAQPALSLSLSLSLCFVTGWGSTAYNGGGG
ncbi:hypothetical protein NHX12_013346 [Muraenolepis orangiensis]|uniref:Peptidase S1 domain-containing protein n=1 Tax=Muraenolepis orangiensis TaxID=630683 RepID=A0A9Q0DH89_9TELE|nr:hypothetical protein NHX12_013346 [Muraenolepis orangiensis]